MDYLVKRLRESRSTWDNAKGVPSDLEREAADRIEALEARIAKADKLAERARRTIDGYGFTADGNDTWREVAAVDLAELETALAVYQDTKEGET